MPRIILEVRHPGFGRAGSFVRRDRSKSMHYLRVCFVHHPLIEPELFRMTTREVGRALSQMWQRTVHSAPVLAHAPSPPDISHLFRLTRRPQFVCNSSTRADSREAKVNRTVHIWILSEAPTHVMPAKSRLLPTVRLPDPLSSVA